MGKNYERFFMGGLLVFLTHFTGYAQELSFIPTSNIQLQIQPLIHQQPLVLGSAFFVPELNDSVQIDRLRFYLSDIRFTNASGKEDTVSQRFFLMDMENPSTLTRNLPLTHTAQWDRIHFGIGVDSAVQMMGAQGGELDPTQGMYWSWRSGYINFKCEGSSPSCPGRNNEFIFHIGGFQAPYNTIQQVDLSISSDTILLQLDLTSIFTVNRISQDYKVMSPNAKAMHFADQIPSLFHVKL